jgi:hypothetical protein
MSNRSLSILISGFTLICALATADIRDLETRIEISAPGTRWKVSFPKDDWKVDQDSATPDGRFAYSLSSMAKGLFVVIRLEKTAKCSTGETCRTYFWDNPSPPVTDPKGVKTDPRNGFQVIQWYRAATGEINATQTFVSAHVYRDGYWIHVWSLKSDSRKGAGPDPTPLLQFLDSIEVK